MKVTIELADWVVALLLLARIPEKVCGTTIEDRLEHWVDEVATSILYDHAIEQDRKADMSVHRRAIPEPDDDIPF